MENKKSTTQIMLMYGGILGLLTIIINLLNYSFGNIYKPHWIINILIYLLMIVFIVLGLRCFKQSNDGYMKLGQAIKIGLGISLISAIIGIIYMFIFANVIEPDFMTNMKAFQEQMMYERFPDMDEAILEKQLEMSQKFMTPGIMAAFALAGSLIIGLIISLIAGAFMKKDPETV